MPLIVLLSAAFVVGAGRFLPWQNAPVGIAALLLVAIGVKAKSPTCSSVGAAVLTVLFTGSAL